MTANPDSQAIQQRQMSSAKTTPFQAFAFALREDSFARRSFFVCLLEGLWLLLAASMARYSGRSVLAFGVGRGEVDGVFLKILCDKFFAAFEDLVNGREVEEGEVIDGWAEADIGVFGHELSVFEAA